MEKHELDAEVTQADSTSTNMLKRVVNALKGHKKIVAGAGAALVAGAIMLATLTAQATTTGFVSVSGGKYDAYPTGTRAIADPSTMSNYKEFPSVAVDGTTTKPLYDTTQYAGRMWTDKTVTVPSDETTSNNQIRKTALFELEPDDQGNKIDFITGDEVDEGYFEVDMSDNATFLTTISALTSALETATAEPVPLDIVLVLDVSGSMGEANKSNTYREGKNPYFSSMEDLVSSLPEPNKNFTTNSSVFTSKPYIRGTDDRYTTTSEKFAGYVEISKNADRSNAVTVPFINKVESNNTKDRFYILTTDIDKLYTALGYTETYYARFINRETLKETHEDWAPTDFLFTNLYKSSGYTQHNRLMDLKLAANAFIEAIAEKNTLLASNGYDTSYMSQIGIVKFSSPNVKTDQYAIYTDYTKLQNDQCTQIVSPLTYYAVPDSENNDSLPAGTTDWAEAETRVNILKHGGATAANMSLMMAEALLDGNRAHWDNTYKTEEPARDGVQHVVIFFTDGNPKDGKPKANNQTSNAPRDFEGDTASSTIGVAERLKKNGTLIYSVALVGGANTSTDLTVDYEHPENSSQNIDLYLNGVSSNFSNASGTPADEITAVYGTQKDALADTGFPWEEVIPAYYTPNPAISWDVNPDDWVLNTKYVPTSDETVQPGKEYYKLTENSDGTVTYVKDESISNYVPAQVFNYTCVKNENDNKYTCVAVPSSVTTPDDFYTYYEKVNYYLAVTGNNGAALTDAFMQILTQITSEEGGATTATGRDGNTAVTITDYLGDYMEFKGLNGILYGKTAATTKFYADATQGAAREPAVVIPAGDEEEDDFVIYTLMPSKAGGQVDSSLLNPPTGEEKVSLTGIGVKVTKGTTAKEGDTVTITIPPELLPTVHYTIEETEDKNGNVKTTVTRNSVNPVRIFYSVGPKTTTVNNVISLIDDMALRSDRNTTLRPQDLQTEDYQNFINGAAAAAWNDTTSGYAYYSLYCNRYTAPAEGVTATYGETEVVTSLAITNPYYFHVDDPLYTTNDTANPTPATTANYSGTGTLYFFTDYWGVARNAQGTYDEYITAHEWTGDYGTYDSKLYTRSGNASSGYTYTVATEADADANTTLYTKLTSARNNEAIYTVYSGKFADWDPDTDAYYIPNGTPRTETLEVASGGYILTKDQVNHELAESARNPTGTATIAFSSTFEANDKDELGNVKLYQYLGNNGRLDIPVYGTLAITKSIEAGTGFDLPDNPTPEADFKLYLYQSDGTTALTGTYTALIRDYEGYPINPETHERMTNAENAKFLLGNEGTFTLRKNETLKITGLPYGTKYNVEEFAETGYTEKVTIKDGDDSYEATGTGSGIQTNAVNPESTTNP